MTNKRSLKLNDSKIKQTEENFSDDIRKNLVEMQEKHQILKIQNHLSGFVLDRSRRHYPCKRETASK